MYAHHIIEDVQYSKVGYERLTKKALDSQGSTVKSVNTDNIFFDAR